MADQKTYIQTIEQYQAEREESIRRENGWLALSGLFWLRLGKNNIGSTATFEIQLPERVPANVGFFEFNGKSVTLRAFSGIKVDVNDVAVDFAVLHTDIEDEPSYITLNDIRMVVIQRGNRMGVRMWDNQVESRRTFPPRTWFAIDESFNLPSQYTRYDRPKTVFFPDLTGEKTESTVEGYITFSYKGKDYKLDISEEDGQLFLRFKDPTSESESYPTGRYIYLDYDAKSGKLMLDFNRAYSPPCAFTDFATCVFAPDQNHLDFRVTAGETFKHNK